MVRPASDGGNDLSVSDNIFAKGGTKHDAHGRGLGFGDFTIIKEWERRCRVHSGHRVYIWSLDELPRSYDRGAG